MPLRIPLPRSIRAQLAALVLAVALPLTALIAYDYSAERVNRIELAGESARSLANAVAASLTQLIETERAMLAALAARPSLQTERPAVCDPLISAAHTLNPYRANVTVSDLAGEPVCSAVPLPAGRALSVINQDYAQRLLRTGEFSMGEPFKGPITGRWVMPLAFPRRDSSGALVGWVGVPLDAERISDLLSLSRTDRGDLINVISPQGRVVSRSSDVRKWVGADVHELPLVQALLEGRVSPWRGTGLDGVARIWGAAEVPGAGWKVVAGVDEDKLLAPANAALLREVLLLALVLLLAAGIAIGISRGISAPIRTLSVIAHRIASGERSLRSPAAGAAEIARIGADFNRMLDALASTDAELIAAAKRFLKVFREAPVAMSVSVERTGELTDVNDAYCALFGYSREELIGRGTVALGLWVDPDNRQSMTDRLRTSDRVRDFEARRHLRSGEIRDIVINTDRIVLDGKPCVLATLIDVTERRTAERELRAAHDRFQKIFHAAPLPGIVSSLKDGRVIEVNDAYCALIGHARDALIGRSVLELGVWSDPGERAALVERLSANSSVRNVEIHVHGKNGEVLDVLMSAERIDFLGEPCTLQMGNDITERKRAEQALRVSEQRFRLAAATGQVWEWNIRTGEISAQQTFWDRLGYEAVEARDQLRMFETYIHPEDLEPWRQAMKDHLARRRPYDLDFRMRATSGEYRWYQTRGQAQWDDDGRAIYMAGTTFDVTEQKRAEQALRESDARQRQVLDNMFPFVGLLSLDGRVLEANRAPLEAAGLARDDVIGKPCAEVYWYSYSPEVQERLRRALARVAAGEAVRYDETIRVAGERFIVIDLMFSPLRDSAGDVVQIVGSATDISERKRAEDALRESGARLEALARRLLEVQEAERAAIARELHDEIGQSLTALKLGMQGLGRGLDEARARKLTDCVAIADRTLAIARNLTLDLRPPQLDHLGLAAALRDSVERIASGAGLEIAFTTDGDYRALEPSRAMALFRVGQEALTNAARHARARRIAVDLRTAGGTLALEVSDDGTGFDLAAARERALRGASMGLFGMEERVALAGGELAVDSRPGEGTRVRARFPVAPPGAAGRPA